MEKVRFATDTDETLEAFLLEQTCIGGVEYLLVTEEETEDSLAYILKAVSLKEEEAVYQVVENDAELQAISKVFEEMLEDVDIEL